MEKLNCFQYKEIQELYASQFVVCKILERQNGKANLFGVVDTFDSKQSAQQLLNLLDNEEGDYIMIPAFDDYELLYKLNVETFQTAPLLEDREIADFFRRYYGWN